MNPSHIFYLLIGIIIVDYIIHTILDSLNASHYSDAIPHELRDVYEKEEYQKSMEYKRTNHSFHQLTSFFSITITLLFFFFDGFAVVDTLARSISDNEITISLLFFGMIIFGNDLLNLPFSYYQTFVIEEKFGFNKTSKTTFVFDKLKGWLMTAILGGGILALIIWFYQLTEARFWLYTWMVIAAVIFIMNMFYTKLIVPLFNKQKPLETGSLRDKIETYASEVGFTLKNISVIDGSKRSTKANAYFSGIGSEKRITLYDTLINDLNEEEIIAVLAHEVGHYKKNHIIINLILSILITGFTLWVLSLLIGNPALSIALGVPKPAFHIGFIAFGILYSPISELTGLLMNWISRKFEYQADNYAKNTFTAESLITSLKKLSKNNLSNLTPHPAYVFMHYSHPTLLQRIKNLNA